MTCVIMVPSCQNILEMSQTKATPGPWSAAVDSYSPGVFFLLSALSHSTRSTKNSFLPSACKEESFFLHHHLPSATQPSVAPLGYKSALRDSSSPLPSPALARKDASWPQDPTAGWCNSPYAERTCSLNPAPCYLSVLSTPVLPPKPTSLLLKPPPQCSPIISHPSGNGFILASHTTHPPLSHPSLQQLKTPISQNLPEVARPG